MAKADVSSLTKNQALVMEALSGSKAPMSAYAILDQLRDAGFRAPPQVYRALDKLVAAGMVHRLESINAFVACSHPDCSGHKTVAFAICDICGEVAEIDDAALASQLGATAKRHAFTLAQSTIELRGTCQACAA